MGPCYQHPGIDPDPWFGACQGSEASLRQQLQAAEEEAAGLRAGLAAAAAAAASGGRPRELELPPRALAVLEGAEQALRDAQVGARAPDSPRGPACACRRGARCVRRALAPLGLHVGAALAVRGPPRSMRRA